VLIIGYPLCGPRVDRYISVMSALTLFRIPHPQCNRQQCSRAYRTIEYNILLVSVQIFAVYLYAHTHTHTIMKTCAQNTTSSGRQPAVIAIFGFGRCFEHLQQQPLRQCSFTHRANYIRFELHHNNKLGADVWLSTTADIIIITIINIAANSI